MNQITVPKLFTLGWKVEGQWFGSFFWGWDQIENTFRISTLKKGKPPLKKGQKGIIRQRQHHWMCDDDAWTEKSDCNFVRCIIIGWKEECEKLEPQLIHTAQRASDAH